MKYEYTGSEIWAYSRKKMIMKKLLAVGAVILGLSMGNAFALGVDVGPVHIHGVNVKVGESTTLSVTVDRIIRDEGDRDRIVKLEAHHQGDKDDRFSIFVNRNDMDDDSRNQLARLREDNTYSMKLERSDSDWKLLKIRSDE